DGRAAADAGRGRPGAVPLRRGLHGDLLDGGVQRLRPAHVGRPGMTIRTQNRPAVGRLLAAYSCSAVATGLPWPLLLVLVWERYGDGPHGALVVGLVAAARMAPYVLLSWAVGSLGDHVRREPLVPPAAA